MALGVTAAGGSFGQFAIVPFVSVLQARLGDWHSTMLILAGLSCVMIPLSLALREQRIETSGAAGPIPQGTRDAIQEALQTRSFWLLLIGFFVCGFHVTFIGLHMPAYIPTKPSDCRC